MQSLRVVDALFLLLGLLPGSTSEGPNTTCQGTCCPTVKVLQRHAWPSFSKSSESGKASADEVTVEFRRCEGLATVLLRLPERQQCEGGEGGNAMCKGYTFRQSQSSEKACVLVRSHSQVLPSNSSIEAADLVSRQRLTGCSVDNTLGDAVTYTATPKRSTATLSLQVPSTNVKAPEWEFFTILVSNPPRTPSGRDVLGTPANSFVLVFKSDNGTEIGSAEYPAQAIRSKWFCSYSPWVLTSPCTAECGGGVRFKVRRLLHPPPKYYDPDLLENCREPLRETVPCNERECDIDCQLGDWVRWADGECTASCGGGWEVQRRRVIQSPKGGGKPCLHWSHHHRVRHVACNPQACEPRCEPGPATGPGNVSLRVGSACSQPCGGGVHTSMVPALRKDEGLPDTSCAAVTTTACNSEECRSFNLFPGKTDLRPWAGAWYDLRVVFYLSDLADLLELRAPKGFDLGGTTCKLIEHNLPRLKSCEVTQLGEGKEKATFDFFNPLEANHARGGQIMYQLRIWVKHPVDCSGGVDPEGVCRGDNGEREWKLTIRTFLPENSWETVSASYEIYQPGAVPDVEKRRQAQVMNEVAQRGQSPAKKATQQP